MWLNKEEEQAFMVGFFIVAATPPVQRSGQTSKVADEQAQPHRLVVLDRDCSVGPPCGRTRKRNKRPYGRPLCRRCPPPVQSFKVANEQQVHRIIFASVLLFWVATVLVGPP